MIGGSLLAAARARQVEAEQAEEALQDGPARHAERPAAELGVPRRAGKRVVVDEQVQLSRAGLVGRRLLDSGPIDAQLHELLLDPLPQCREEEGQHRLIHRTLAARLADGHADGAAVVSVVLQASSHRLDETRFFLKVGH